MRQFSNQLLGEGWTKFSNFVRSYSSRSALAGMLGVTAKFSGAAPAEKQRAISQGRLHLDVSEEEPSDAENVARIARRLST